ncbi:MAG: hypothetical protein H6737_20750 [Alphaproteobacteria bacterium]|nr:hypothetical protein [Alphaproteobacteria bacterium]
MFRTSIALGLLLPALATGCAWDEGLEIRNMTGTVVIPREAATRTFQRSDGTVEEVTDVRLIGPVYVGLYPSVQPEDTVQRYPHPEVGPLFSADLSIGDAYPYGGTTIGTFRSACLKDMACRIPSGRFYDFQEMADWFADTLESPIKDIYDQPITSGELIRQTCFSTLNYTSDAEIGLTVTSDRNEDGVLDHEDLDFVERTDGNFEGEFLIWQQEYATNADGQGFTLWAFMDSPAPGDGAFSTCDSTRGRQVDEYAEDFRAGAVYQDLLNRPSVRLNRGDWVAGQQEATGDYGYIYQSPDDLPEIWINWQID